MPSFCPAALGANVTAVERETQRLIRLRENLERLKLSADLIEADLRDYTPSARAPFVLLDAPCSATGTIRRHPELPWIKSAGDINLSAQAAGEFLDAAARMVAPGGLRAQIDVAGALDPRKFGMAADRAG